MKIAVSFLLFAQEFFIANNTCTHYRTVRTHFSFCKLRGIVLQRKNWNGYMQVQKVEHRIPCRLVPTLLRLIAVILQRIHGALYYQILCCHARLMR